MRTKDSPTLIGPAASVLEAARVLAKDDGPLRLLLDGNPGNGKTTLADQLAREITGNAFSVELVNGQSLGIELVRSWRDRGRYGNLFSDWTVKRIDEIDSASPSAIAELLTYLDYLPPRTAVIATTNDYAKLQATSKGRLESRFIRYHVDSPTIEETTLHLSKTFCISATIACEIAKGSVPIGMLESEGCNVRTACNDARAFVAVKASAPAKPPAKLKLVKGGAKKA